MRKKPKSSFGWVLLFPLFFFIPSQLIAQVVFVDHSATGANDGTSWSDAFVDLSDALVKAEAGDEIWVAQGVYIPNDRSDDTPQSSTFSIPSGVAVYGGFKGGEAIRDGRNWELYRTILSGDIGNNDENADGNYIAEDVGDIVGDNAYHVVTTFRSLSSTIVDGFIITAGNANGTGEFGNGGGWYNHFFEPPSSFSNPHIANCIFSGNRADFKGGAFYSAVPSGFSIGMGQVISAFDNCRFIQNVSMEGAAIYLSGNFGGVFQLNITNCHFTRNESDVIVVLNLDRSQVASSIFDQNLGTAVKLNGSNASFSQCIFENNTGAGISTFTEGPLTLSDESKPRIFNCGFYGNGTGVFNAVRESGILRPSFINCVFSGNRNRAVRNSNDLVSSGSRFSLLESSFTNCTFTENQTDGLGGAIYNSVFPDTGGPIAGLMSRLENCILWNNTAADGGPEIFSFSEVNNYAAFSIIKGCGGSGAGWNPALGIDGGNNKDTDPLFVNIFSPIGPDGTPATADDGLRLAVIPSLSPGVEAGNNFAAGLAGVTTDYIGNPRFLSRVDMGAYEQRRSPVHRLTEWPRPGCLTCPWSMLITQFGLSFNWEEEGRITEDDAGKFTIVTGKLVSTLNEKIGFEIYLKFINPQDWKTWSAKGRTYFAFTSVANAVAKKTIDNWTFWELSDESYMIGSGELSGKIALLPFPSNFKLGFQFGEGANGWDEDLGLGGSFSYNGTLSRNGKKINLKGLGSINVDAQPCSNCIPPPPTDAQVALHSELKRDNHDFNVFPIPASNYLTIGSESIPSGKYSLSVYNSKSELKKLEALDTDNGDHTIAVEGLERGIYFLKLISSTGEIFMKKVIIE